MSVQSAFGLSGNYYYYISDHLYILIRHTEVLHSDKPYDKSMLCS